MRRTKSDLSTYQSRNSINLLRLFFALAVIVSHAWPLGGFGEDPGLKSNNLGILAVEGFFVLSGFLITKSALSFSTRRYLWHRFLRIFPAYWLSLVLVAFGFALVVWRSTNSLGSFFTSAQPPAFGFVFNNLFLSIGQTSVGNTLANNPFPNMWNGPLYTLFWEFSCYLVIALMAASKWLSKLTVGLILCASWVSLQVVNINVLVGQIDDRSYKFVLMFALGSFLFFYQDQLLSRQRVVVPLALSVLAATSYFWIGFEQIGVVAFGYLVLWLALNVKFTPQLRKTDYSYGLYLFGWPVLQIATYFGLTQFGIASYLAFSILASFTLAVLSWHLVEVQVMKFKNVNFRFAHQ